MRSVSKHSQPSMPFFQCHASFLKRMQHENLTVNDIAILAYLMSNLLFRKTITRPTSYDEIMEYLECSDSTVRRSVKRLSELGYFDILYKKHREFVADMRVVSVTRSMIKDYYERKAKGEPLPEMKTRMPYFQLNRENIRKIKQKKLSPCETLVFLYLLTSVDVDSGNTHHVNIAEIAEYYGYHRDTIKRALNRLDEAGLIDITKISFTFTAAIHAVAETKQAAADAKAARAEREKYVKAGFTDMFGRGDNDEISQEILDMLSPEVRRIVEENG